VASNHRRCVRRQLELQRTEPIAYRCTDPLHGLLVLGRSGPSGQIAGRLAGAEPGIHADRVRFSGGELQDQTAPSPGRLRPATMKWAGPSRLPWSGIAVGGGHCGVPTPTCCLVSAKLAVHWGSGPGR